MPLACLSDLRSLKLTEPRRGSAVPAAYEVLRNITSERLEELSIADCSETQLRWFELSALFNGPKFSGLQKLVLSGWVTSPEIADELAVRWFLEQQFPQASFAARDIIQVEVMPVPEYAAYTSSESDSDTESVSDTESDSASDIE